MDGPRAGQDAMRNCTDQEYWDTLVSQCIPCSLACRQSLARKCDAVCGLIQQPQVNISSLRTGDAVPGILRQVLVCPKELCKPQGSSSSSSSSESSSQEPPESMDCNKRPGFYFDDLVKTCIRCSSVCGQHPRECAPSCEPTPAAVLEPEPCAEQEPWLALWLLLGLCLASLGCSLLLGWSHLRRRGEPGSCQPSAAPCHCREDPAKDGLVEAGSVAEGFTSIRIPEPVETCGFCFPGHGSAVQETKPCPSSSGHPGERAAPSFSGICSSGSAGALPSPEDGHFKIICSPAQEKTPMV